MQAVDARAPEPDITTTKIEQSQESKSSATHKLEAVDNIPRCAVKLEPFDGSEGTKDENKTLFVRVAHGLAYGCRQNPQHTRINVFEDQDSAFACESSSLMGSRIGDRSAILPHEGQL